MCNINGHHVFAYARRQVTFDEDELTKANTHTTLAFPSVRQTDYRILAMPNWSAKNHRRWKWLILATIERQNAQCGKHHARLRICELETNCKQRPTDEKSCTGHDYILHVQMSRPPLDSATCHGSKEAQAWLIMHNHQVYWCWRLLVELLSDWYSSTPAADGLLFPI